MALHDISVTTIDGRDTTLGEWRGDVLLVVNVASRCGYTPQYAGLQQLHERFRDQGFTVLGFPCNQFLFQEPGSASRIADFCSTTYGVTFPMFDKVKVRGRQQHPLFAALTETADQSGATGGVKWNFEKFLVSRAGEPTARWRSAIAPDAPELVAAVDAALASTAA